MRKEFSIVEGCGNIAFNSNIISGSSNNSVFTRGYISVYNRHTHYAVLWNSESISVVYGGKSIFCLPEKQWEILNAKGPSPREPNMVKLCFMRHGQPVVVFYGRHRETNVCELVYYDIMDGTWEAFSISKITCIDVIQDWVLMGRGDGRLTWARLPDLDEEKSISFSTDQSALNVIHVKDNYVFVGQINGTVQVFKVKRNDSTMKLETLDEVVDIPGQDPVVNICAEKVIDRWVVAVASDSSASPVVKIYYLKSGTVQYLETLDFSPLNKENQCWSQAYVNSLEFTFSPKTQVLLLYTALVGNYNMGSGTFSYNDLFCHGLEENRMRLVKNEAEFNVDASKVILDVACRWSTTEVNILYTSALYSYAAFYPQVPKSAAVDPNMVVTAETFFDTSHFPYLLGSVNSDIERNRASLGGKLFIDLMIESFLGGEDFDEIPSYPPRSTIDFNRLFSACYDRNGKNDNSALILYYFTLDFEHAGISAVTTANRHTMSSSSLQPVPALRNLVQGYWYLDHGQYSEALRSLLDPSVKDISWISEIVGSLHRLGQYMIAYKLIRLGQVSFDSLADKEMVLEIFWRVSILEAFEYQKRHFYVHSSEPGHLLKKFLALSFAMDKTNDRHRIMNILQRIPFDDREEQVLIQYCRDESFSLFAKDFLLTYYIARGRFLEAIPFYEKNRELGVYAACASMSMEESNSSTSSLLDDSKTLRQVIMEKLKSNLPQVQRKVLLLNPDRMIGIEPILNKDTNTKPILTSMEEGMTETAMLESIGSSLQQPPKTPGRQSQHHQLLPSSSIISPIVNVGDSVSKPAATGSRTQASPFSPAVAKVRKLGSGVDKRITMGSIGNFTQKLSLSPIPKVSFESEKPLPKFSRRSSIIAYGKGVVVESEKKEELPKVASKPIESDGSKSDQSRNVSVNINGNTNNPKGNNTITTDSPFKRRPTSSSVSDAAKNTSKRRLSLAVSDSSRATNSSNRGVIKKSVDIVSTAVEANESITGIISSPRKYNLRTTPAAETSMVVVNAHDEEDGKGEKESKGDQREMTSSRRSTTIVSSNSTPSLPPKRPKSSLASTSKKKRPISAITNKEGDQKAINSRKLLLVEATPSMRASLRVRRKPNDEEEKGFSRGGSDDNNNNEDGNLDQRFVSTTSSRIKNDTIEYDEDDASSIVNATNGGQGIIVTPVPHQRSNQKTGLKVTRYNNNDHHHLNSSSAKLSKKKQPVAEAVSTDTSITVLPRNNSGIRRTPATITSTSNGKGFNSTSTSTSSSHANANDQNDLPPRMSTRSSSLSISSKPGTPALKTTATMTVKRPSKGTMTPSSTSSNARDTSNSTSSKRKSNNNNWKI